MTLAAVGTLIWPPLLSNGGAGLSTTYSANNVTYDSATDRLAWVGTAPFADSITTLYFRTSNVTTGCTIEARIETVTNGRPSGTLWATTTNGTVVVANTDDNVWKTVTLTSAATMALGDLFAIVFVVSSGTPNMQFKNIPTVFSALQGANGQLALQDTGAGSWVAGNGYEAFIETTNGGPTHLPGLLPLDGDCDVSTFNSGSSPDEKAMKFVPPFKCRVVGMIVTMMNQTAGSDLTFSIWPASSTVDGDALAQLALDGDTSGSTTQDGNMIVFLDTAVTLTAGTTYYAGVRADTANNIIVVNMPVPSGITNAIKAMPPGSTSHHLSTRAWSAGSAGAWTDTTTNLPCIHLIIDQLDDGASTGGGLLTHPGMGGGMRG